MLGGKVRLMPCGAAPFDYKVLQFFRAALGAAVLEVELLTVSKTELNCVINPKHPSSIGMKTEYF